MSDYIPLGDESEVAQIRRTEANRLVSARLGNFYGFDRHSAGELVVVDLIGEETFGIQREPDEVIIGTLTVDKTVQVLEASNHPELADKEIGLAMITKLDTPIGIPIVAPVYDNFWPFHDAAYYEPLANMGTQPQAPRPECKYLWGKYGRVQVGKTILFDIVN